jgi:TatD DNase family protein
MSATAAGDSSQERPLLIDTHCHLDDPSFEPDRGDVIAASARAGVVGWINIGFHPGRWPTTVHLSHSTTGMWHALGVHPQHASEWAAETRDALKSLVASSGAVAIGEIGLDYARGTRARDTQRRAFAQQLELSLALGLPVIIHQRSAEHDLVDMLAGFPRNHPVLLHSFEGEERLTALAIERKYVVGVGGLATRPRNEALRDRLRSLPLDQTVVESDAPYLVPHGVTGKRNTPAHVTEAARLLARVHSVTIQQVAAATTATATRFFSRAFVTDATDASQSV